MRFRACVCKKNKIHLDAFGNEFWRCINAVRCLKWRHAARCIYKMQGIFSVKEKKWTIKNKLEMNPQQHDTTSLRDLSDLAHGSSDWSVLSGNLWRMGAHIPPFPRAQRNAALTVLLWMLSFFGQWDSLLSDQSLEFFFSNKKNIYHSSIVELWIYWLF